VVLDISYEERGPADGVPMIPAASGRFCYKSHRADAVEFKFEKTESGRARF
jgi:hypothetical protein